jgi:hypothetical protein
LRPSTDPLLRRPSNQGLIRCLSIGLTSRLDILNDLSGVHTPHMYVVLLHVNEMLS